MKWMSVVKALERPNILFILTSFADSFVGWQILKSTVLRLNHRVALSVRHHLAFFILPFLDSGLRLFSVFEP